MKQPVSQKNNAPVISKNVSQKIVNVAPIVDKNIPTPASSYEENFPELSAALFTSSKVGKTKAKQEFRK